MSSKLALTSLRKDISEVKTLQHKQQQPSTENILTSPVGIVPVGHFYF
jgi:hypothetical protein